VNLLLLDSSELTADNRTTLSDRRAQHICQVLQAKTGTILNAGVLNGERGSAEVIHINSARTAVHLKFLPNLNNDTSLTPKPLQITVVMALPRPKVAKRLIAVCAECGIKELHFINSFRVEKSFWQSPLLSPHNIHQQLLLGLEQSKDTQLPTVSLHSRFKPFVEDRLNDIRKNKRCLLAHPYNADITLNERMHRGLTTDQTGHVIVIGPEGGFIPYEVELLRHNGCQSLAIGVRIYRVETVLPMLLALLSND
tara:strand:- start:383 stop:1141 length:759 start_codon:yes stop_codon:yes gene_type:complete